MLDQIGVDNSRRSLLHEGFDHYEERKTKQYKT